VRRQHSLIQMRVDEENRRSVPMVSPAVTASIEATLEHLARELERVDREIEQLNLPIRALATRLSARGKTKMTIVAAAMRKLLTLAYGVLKSGRVFDPLYANA